MPATNPDESNHAVDALVRHPEPGWIGEALGTTVKGLETRLLGEARGFQSTTWLLQLNCDPPDGAPASVILKSETANEAFNTFSRLNNAFVREVGVYTHCTPGSRITSPAFTRLIPASPSGCCWKMSPICAQAIR